MTEYPSMLGPNPFLVPASYPSPFGTPLHPLHSPELSLAAQAANARKGIQDWRKSTIEAQIRYAADMFSAQRPNALRDDMQSTSATDATGPPICDSGCPRQALAVGTTLRGRDCNSGRLHREELLHGLIYDEDQDMPGCCCSVCVLVCLPAMLTCLLRKLLAREPRLLRKLVCCADSCAARTASSHEHPLPICTGVDGCGED